MEKVSFLKHELEHPIINAAGTCKTLEDVKKQAKLATTVITVGSGTKLASPGNPGNVWHVMPHNTINSIGLTNPGQEYYDKNLDEMVRIAHDSGKRIIFSAAGNTPEEFHSLIQMSLSHDVDYGEINDGCPNKWHEGVQGQIFSFDFDISCKILDMFTPEEHVRIGLKVSPYSDPTMRDRLVDEVILHFPALAYLASSNTYPNCFAFQDNWRPAIDSSNVPNGYGGGAGPGFKEMVLGQNHQIRAALDKHLALKGMPIIGIGGVNSGRGVLEHIRCGATLVGIASEYMKAEDPNVFSRILTEYVDLVEKEEE